MRKVFICSSLKADNTDKLNANIQRAKSYCRFAYEQGYNPFAPHAFYTAFLDDLKPKERTDGMEMGQQWMWAMNEVWVFGQVTEGMAKEIELAKTIGVEIKYFTEDMIRITCKSDFE